MRYFRDGHPPYISDNAPKLTHAESLLGILNKFPIRGKAGGPGGKGRPFILLRIFRRNEKMISIPKAPVAMMILDDISCTYSVGGDGGWRQSFLLTVPTHEAYVKGLEWSKQTMKAAEGLHKGIPISRDD